MIYRQPGEVNDLLIGKVQLKGGKKTTTLQKLPELSVQSCELRDRSVIVLFSYR